MPVSHKATVSFLRGWGAVHHFDDTYIANSAPEAVFGSSSTWDGGGTDNNWTTAANWVGDIAPTVNSTLVFPLGAARLTNNNNFAAGTTFAQLSFTGGGYNITGNAITLLRGITVTAVSGGAITFAPNVTVNAAQAFTNAGQPTTLSGQLNLNGFALTVSGANDLAFTGTVTGVGGITKTGAGTLVLLGTGNNYTGITQINAGVVDVRSTNALGATGAGNNTVVVAHTP